MHRSEGSKQAERATHAMLAVRGGLGAAAYLAPRVTGRAMGLDPDGQPHLGYLARVFGARDVALSVAVLALDERARRPLLWACVGVDCADILSAALAARAGHTSRYATASLTLAALAALVPELYGLAASRRRTDRPEAASETPGRAVLPGDRPTSPR